MSMSMGMGMSSSSSIVRPTTVTVAPIWKAKRIAFYLVAGWTFGMCASSVKPLSFSDWRDALALQQSPMGAAHADAATQGAAAATADCGQAPTHTTNNSSDHNNNRTGICSFLPVGTTASLLWKQNMGVIADATRGPALRLNVPPGDTYPDWIEPLLQFISTSYLRKGYRQGPLRPVYQQVLDIVYNRIINATHHPPLRVAVFGGSVTEGRNSCHDAELPPRFANQPRPAADKGTKCNWVKTVQRLMDAALGEKVVEIHNLAIGGTGTGTSIPVIKYKLYAQGSPFLPAGPDVIINAYSTNDAYVPQQMDDVTEDAHWQSNSRHQAQEFIRSAIQSRPCSDLPMVMYFDDYLGNQHNIIMGENMNGHIIREMADWYNIFLVSYADAVRRVVYANSAEERFSATWNWKDPRPAYRTDAHFPMTGHFTAAWVMCFAILQSVVDFCEDGSDAEMPPFPKEFPKDVVDLVNRVPPPRLDKGILLENISTLWQTAGKEQEQTRQSEECKSGIADTIVPCPFAFVAGPAGTVRSTGQIDSYLNGDRVVRNDGWQGIDDSSNGWSMKIGYVPTKPNATSTFFVDDLKADLKTLKISYLKSYGEKWMNSRVRFTVRSIETNAHSAIVSTFDLEGYHNSTVSISFSYGSELLIPKGQRVEVEMQLVGGTSFKLISFMLCHH